MSSINSQIVYKSMIWKIAEKFLVQLMNFIVLVVLARILMPSDYGIVAIVQVFISLANVIIQNGFNQIIIQNKEKGESFFGSTIFVNLVFSIIIYPILYFGAIPISIFFDNIIYINIIRIYALTIFVSSIWSVFYSYAQKKMKVIEMFLSTSIATAISGTFAVILAMNDFGVWALVIQQITYNIVLTITLFLVIRIKNIDKIKKEYVITILSDGWKITLTNFISIIFLNIRSIIIGKKYDDTSLGLFEKGKQLPYLMINVVDLSLQSVMFPTYSSEKNPNRLKAMLRKSIKISAMIVFPAMIGIFILADKIVLVLFTERWMEIVPFVRIFALFYLLLPLHTSNVQMMLGMGKNKMLLITEIIKKAIEIVILLISINFGLYYIAIGSIISSVISLEINSFNSRINLHYGSFHQLKDTFVYILGCIFMIIAVLLVDIININLFLKLTIQVLSGFIVYVGFLFIIKEESFIYVIQETRKIINSKFIFRKNK